MLIGWDADGHVHESEATFSDRYLDPEFRARRPVVVETGVPDDWVWVVDEKVYPRSSGPGGGHGGPKVGSRNGVISPRYQATKPFDPVESTEFHSAAARLKQMDQEHIAVQVNYPTMFLGWPLAQDPALGGALARSYNNWMADISGQAPDRLMWVTVIEPGDPKESAKEIERTKEMGSVGVMLLGMVGNKHIDDPSMEPIWAAAAEAELPVALHVGFCCPALGDLYGRGDTLVVPFAMTVLMGFQRVVSTGLLDRYPKLQVGFLEAGCGWVAYMVDRINEYSGKPGTRLTSPRVATGGRGFVSGSYTSELLPSEYIQSGRLYFGFEADEEGLPYFINEFGSDCLLYASDIPHFDRLVDATALFQERTDLSDETKRKALIDNVARFYGLTIPKAVPKPAAS